MPLGTLDRTPPPFFRQGPTARTKLIFFSALALFLMVADARFRLTQPLRATLNLVLLPVQHALAVPVDMARGGGAYLQGLDDALKAQSQAQALLAKQAERAHRADTLAAENKGLRELLELRPALQTRALTAEVMYEAADPFSRKFFIDSGSARGVKLGSPVINDLGVLGQVTRVYALASEVTLLADKDAAIPVLNVRTQQRSAAFGGVPGPGGSGPGSAVMELRFMSGNADLKVGDLLHTSGVDGVYPPGLPVARVASVERRVESSFARVLLTPAAPPDAVRHVLVLEPIGLQRPARPAPEEAPAPRTRRGAKAAIAAASASAASGASAASAASGVRP